MRKIIFLSFLILSDLIFWQLSFSEAQNTIELKKTLTFTDSLLQLRKEQKRFDLEQLILINKQIRTREQLLENYEQKREKIKNELKETGEQIKKLQNELEKLKKEYAKIIYFAYKNRNPYNKIMLILSAESFNQSYKRMRYILQYEAYTRKQAKTVIQKDKELKSKYEEQKKNKKKYDRLISEIIKETFKLDEEQNYSRNISTQIKFASDLLEEKLKDDKLQEKELDTNIKKTINRIVNKKTKIKTAKRATPKKLGSSYDNTNFALNKGNLSWPVQEGIVYNYFGRHPHPLLPKIMLQNNGIDLRCPENTNVYAIFPGEIKKIVAIPGNNFAVILKHNNFYTVYSNIRDLKIRKMKYIKKGTILGKVAKDKQDGTAKMQFQLWNNTKKEDPLLWLKQRK